MILLFSGGYDSTLLALRYLSKIKVLLHIQYIHPSRDYELMAVGRLYEELKQKNPSICLKILEIPLYAQELSAGVGVSGSRYVPNRNAIFLSLAANVARVHQCDTIIYGATSCDQEDYFDCTPAFMETLSFALRIEICAPLLDTSLRPFEVSSTDVHRLLSLSWSCYQPDNGKPCGKCNSCKQR